MTVWHWSSRLGFIMAAMGSAIGLANLIRFPAYVSLYGGTAFVMLYVFFLVVIAVPIFLAEVAIGHVAQGDPERAFYHLSHSRWWAKLGTLMLVTSFVISTFYSVIAGWIVGYILMAWQGMLDHVTTMDQAQQQFHAFTGSCGWPLLGHGIFMLLSVFVLIRELQQGLERWNPILLFCLAVMLLCLWWLVALPLTGSDQWLRPRWHDLTSTSVLMALGQAFFTLSVGQGTMITYGSYLKQDGVPLWKMAIPVALADTLISLAMVVIVLSLVHSTPETLREGLSLLFQTVPVVSSQHPWGSLITLSFFTLALLAALTSQVSVMEPSIDWLSRRYHWSRRRSVLSVGVGAFVFGIPSAWSFSVLQHVTWHQWSILASLDWLVTSLLLPLGALASVCLVAYRWGITSFMQVVFKQGHMSSKFWGRLYGGLIPCVIVLVMLMYLLNYDG